MSPSSCAGACRSWLEEGSPELILNPETPNRVESPWSVARYTFRKTRTHGTLGTFGAEIKWGLG